ncbi:MAG: hypothetical protein ACXWG1_08860 [Usitatibacter sp.]
MAQEAPGAKLRAATYDGKWVGAVDCLHDPGLWPEDECGVRFTFNIQGSRISVEQIVRSKNGVETKSIVNPGKFALARLSTNAVAVSMDSGKDEDGTWVETWTFAMSLTDPDHMLVHWTRIVNNLDLPRAKKGSKFSSVGMGEFARVQRVPD